MTVPDRRSLVRRTFGGQLVGVLLGLSCAEALCDWGADARADEARVRFKVIVGPSLAISAASREVVADMFLKRVVEWPNGDTVKPVDQKATSAVRRAFSEQVLKRSVAAVRSYWQQRIFSGRDVPPPEVESDGAVVQYVLKYPGAVGYVSEDADIGSARVLQLR